MLIITIKIKAAHQTPYEEYICRVGCAFGFTNARSRAAKFETIEDAKAALASIEYSDKTEYFEKGVNCDFNAAPGQICFKRYAELEPV